MAHIPRTQIRPTEYMLSKTTILIVDDEAGPRESLKMILSPAHRILAATNGTEALEIMQSESIDLVTVDLRMPGMGGEELMRTIRNEHPATEIIVITGNSDIQSAVEGLRFGICDYISKPFDVVEVSGAVSRALERKQQRSHLVDFLEGIGSVLGKDRDSGELLEDLESNDELRGELRASLNGDDAAGAVDKPDQTLEFLDVLAQALESRDRDLRKHSQRVGFYADLLAEQIGVPDPLRDQIRLSSFLHDIGKVGLTERDRQRAQLRSRADVTLEEEHPEMGASLVGPLGFDDPVAKAIRHHHEHWNGGGHPAALEGEDIPLASRVIAVVDSFDKLTSGIGDNEPQSNEEALSEIQKLSGSRFDPAIVHAFACLVENGSVDIGRDESEPRNAAGMTG